MVLLGDKELRVVVFVVIVVVVFFVQRRGGRRRDHRHDRRLGAERADGHGDGGLRGTQGHGHVRRGHVRAGFRGRRKEENVKHCFKSELTGVKVSPEDLSLNLAFVL